MLPYSLRASNFNENLVQIDEHMYKPHKLNKPITVITLGAGSCGNAYGDYRRIYPDQMETVGVAEPNQERNKRYAEKHEKASQNFEKLLYGN